MRIATLLLSEAADSIVVVSSTSAGSQVARTSACRERFFDKAIPIAGLALCMVAGAGSVSTCLLFVHDSQVRAGAEITWVSCMVIGAISLCIIYNRHPRS